MSDQGLLQLISELNGNALNFNNDDFKNPVLFVPIGIMVSHDIFFFGGGESPSHIGDISHVSSKKVIPLA